MTASDQVDPRFSFAIQCGSGGTVGKLGSPTPPGSHGRIVRHCLLSSITVLALCVCVSHIVTPGTPAEGRQKRPFTLGDAPVSLNLSQDKSNL